MSVQYFLDGYNVIHQIPALACKRSLREARESLIRLLVAGNFSGSVRNRLTIVFDGQPGVDHAGASSFIKVVFSSSQSADDLMRDMVEKSAAKKSIYAITDDKALAQSIRALGARTIRVKEFFASAMPSAKTSSRQQRSARSIEEKHISATEASQINDELAGIWLK